MSYGISVNLRARQPEGRFYMGLDEALDLYNGGLVQAIMDAVDKAEQDLERDKLKIEYAKVELRTAQATIKHARDAINKTIK